MTPCNGVGAAEPPVNWRNFHKACRLAQLSDAITAMFTGKGEPTLFPDQITQQRGAAPAHILPIRAVVLRLAIRRRADIITASEFSETRSTTMPTLPWTIPVIS
jgi:hypothetical protein